MAIWRGGNLGILFQFFQLLPALTLLQNVILPMDLAGKYAPRERRKRAEHLAGNCRPGRASAQAAQHDLRRAAAAGGAGARAGQ